MEQEYQAPPLIFLGQRGPEAAQRGPEHAYTTAYELLANRMPVEALALLEPALEAEPTNTGLRTLRVWAWMIRAQLGPAEQELRAMVEENPSDDWMQHALGRVLERQSRPEEALPYLRLASIMSGEYDHQAAVLRVEREIERSQG